MFRKSLPSLTRKMLFGAGCGTTSFLLSQNYLAKHHTDSSFYWRNNAYLSNTLFQLAHQKYIDRFINLSKIFSAAQLETNQCLSAINTMPDLMELKTLFNKLDDIIDGATAETVLSFQEASMGPELNPFLSHLLDEDDKKILHQFVDHDLITEKELFSFGNLLSYKLYTQAQLTLTYEQTTCAHEKIALRKQISQENIETSGIYLALIIHFIKKDKKLFELVNQSSDNALTYDKLKMIYPAETRAGELMQIVHDVPEFRYDLIQELTIGKISANYFLAMLEEKDLLNQFKNEIDQLPNRPISFYELPDKIKEVFFELENDFKANTSTIGIMAQMVYDFSWEYERQVGFYTQKPRH